MKGTLGITYLVERQYADALAWLDQAGRTPGSPPVVALVTAAAHALNGEDADARFWIARARQQNPEISIEQFRKATPMADAELQNHMIRLLTQNWS